MSKQTLELGRLHERANFLVKLALELGWAAQNTHGGGVLVTSQVDVHQRIEFPANGQLRDQRYVSALRKIIRYAEPMRLPIILSLIEDPKSVRLAPDSVLLDLDATTLNLVRKQMSVDEKGNATEDPEPDEELAVPGPQRRAAKRATQSAPKTLTLVSQRPWLAHRGSTDKASRAYESDAVIERHWSDGSTDYMCSWPGCGWSSALPVSVARHYGRSASHSVEAIGGPDMKAPPYEWSSRSQARADRLAAEILAALDHCPDCSTDEPAHLAQKIAEEMVRRREALRQVHGHDDEPLTPEQLIERIRRLVDDGSYLRRIEAEAEQQARLEVAEAQVAALADQLARSEANCEAIVKAAEEGAANLARERERAAALEADWQALSDLIDRKGIKR